ncbi:MAG TPA: lipopolysaccharide biosynthesis protein [Saprospiraceae bacterium]|nr:lipopolysaccharide biosynthesis protein [Saprospiraceae bacterium]
MGVIKFQSIRYSLFNALAIGLGALAIIFIIPYDKTSYGIVNMIFAAAYLLSPVLGLGLPMVIIKYYPYFKNKGKEDYYLGFSLALTALVTFSLALVLSLFFAEFSQAAAFFGLDSDFIMTNKINILILSVLLVFNYVIISFSALQKKIAIPELLSNVAYKIYVPVLIILVYSKYLGVQHLGLGLILFYVLSTLAILVYVSRMRTWKWSTGFSFVLHDKESNLTGFMLQSGLQTLANGILLRLDVLMVGLILGPFEAGIYGIILFMTSTLEIASKAISQISAPIISQKWAEDNLAEIGKIYSKSAVVLTVISCLLFVLLYFNFPHIFKLMPKTEFNQDWILVMTVLCLARIVDLGFSLNGVILTYSNLIRYNIGFLIFSGILYFILLVNLLPEMGMLGAAISYLVVILFFNLAKHILIKLRWKLDPINFNLLKVVAIAGVTFLAAWFLPQSNNPWLAMMVNSIVILFLYILGLFVLKPSEDIELMIHNIKARILK